MHFERVLEPDHVRTLLNDYTLAYAAYHRNILHANARHVGDRRNMITVAIAGAFNDPLVYANPAVMPVIEALLGAEVHITTLSGKKLALTIPPGTQNGRVFRLTGQGLPRFGTEGSGDLRVRTKVVLPTFLDDEGREKAEAFIDHINQTSPRT